MYKEIVKFSGSLSHACNKAKLVNMFVSTDYKKSLEALFEKIDENVGKKNRNVIACRLISPALSWW